jgi:hypothetical protein
MKIKIFYFSLLFLVACKIPKDPKGVFDAANVPNPPDYANIESWSALPNKKDCADLTPPSLKDGQTQAEADVFFLYPTVYTGVKSYQTNWNAPIDLPSFNHDVDFATVKYQATIFNAAGKIYAPRYRQAHIKAYFPKGDKIKEESSKQAFDLAYEDVKASFEYYLKHYNNGRPIIIAGHSQGTTHAIRLLKEYFDGKPLQKRLVVAYLVGIPVGKNNYKNIKVCENADETGCFCTWRTFAKGYIPKKAAHGKGIEVVNPLSWTTEETYAPNELNLGGVVKDFKKIRTGIVDAQVHEGMIWASRPRFPGSFLLRIKNYHAGDYNLYYMNVRENAVNRVRNFYKK